MNPDIPIVVIGFDRPGSLERLLNSLSGAFYRQDVPLYISLDGSKGEKENKKATEEVLRVAAHFDWKFGEKKIIRHEQNLGLRQHVLKCGDLSEHHDALVVLEDDLAVSPGFYEFALQAYRFYHADPGIGGISLYHHAYNETAQFPFVPLADGSDAYFLKYASSWGQVWPKEQWKHFRKWYDRRISGDGSAESFLPPNILLWPENSWKKYFVEYLARHDLYFVFPRYSMTTLFGDGGTNIRIRETFLQVPLWYGVRPFHFIPLENSVAVYDTFCEILPDRLKKLAGVFEGEDFVVDLYGMKPSSMISSEKVLSGRECRLPERSFGREMKPHEENIVHGIPGNYFHFGKREAFSDPPYLARLLKCHEKREISYWYPVREFHFHGNALLSTDHKAWSFRDPLFLFRKLRITARYAWRYFRGRRHHPDR